MNDIRLIKNNGIEEKYDWSFTFNDLDIVRGKMQLINAVRHAVLLRPGELLQEPYTNKGCRAYEHILNGNTTNGQVQVCGHVEDTAKQVEGIHNAHCTVVEDDLMDYKVQLELLTDEMEEVTINEF